MKSTLTITIRKRTQPELLIWLIVIMPFLFGTLFDFLPLPSRLKYVLDISWLILFVLVLLNVKNSAHSIAKNRILFLWCIAFLLVTLIVYIFNYQSVFYYLWGVRNNFRYYVLFLACIAFLKREDIVYYFRLFDVVFWINAVICLIQYFVFDIRGDHLGGVFGTTVGCNAYTNLFFIIIAIKSIVYYLNKKESLGLCLAKCGTMLIIAAMAEIKFFYPVFIIIVAMAALITDFSWRKLMIIIAGFFAVIVGAYILAIIFPESAQFLSIEFIYDYATSDSGYTSSGDINRLTAVSIISELFLTTFPKRLLGLGLGNCDTATFSFLQTPFYAQYSSLNYSWFSLAFLFLETGYLGLLFFFGFFIVIFILGRKVAHSGMQGKICGQIAAILAICCILTAVYNSSLRTEAGYMAYVVLSFPFILQKSRVPIKLGDQDEA